MIKCHILWAYASAIIAAKRCTAANGILCNQQLLFIKKENILLILIKQKTFLLTAVHDFYLIFFFTVTENLNVIHHFDKVEQKGNQP